MELRANNQHILLFPVKIAIVFLLFTEILYIIGPINYRVDNYGYTIIYLLLCNLFLYLGYINNVYYYRHNHRYNEKYNKITKFILITSLIILVFKLYNVIGSISPTAIYNKIYDSLLSPDEAYKEKLEGSEDGISIWTYIFMLLSPITSAAIPFGIFYWKKLSKTYRYITFFLILGEILYWISLGTRKGIFDTIFIVIFIFFAANTKYLTDKHKYRKIIAYITCSIIIFIFYFIWSNMSRLGADNIQDYGNLFYEIKDSYRSIPSPITTTLFSIEGYLCQGYYALSKSLEEFMYGNIMFTFGCGNNFFTLNVLERFDINLIDNTYQKLLYDNYGIHPYINWHSIYVWLANDVTFIGVPLVMYAIGALYAKTWVGCINNNFYAIPIFSLTMLMVMYSYANNQILSFSFFAFILWLYLYIKQ